MAEDRGSEIAVVLCVFMGLSWLFVFLRVIVRLFITKSWSFDDSLLTVSLFLYTLYGTAGLQSVRFGNGQHADQISREDLPRALQAWWFDESLYALTTLFVRLSISVFLLRLSTRSLHKSIIYATQASVITFTIIFIVLVFCQCTPFDYFWKQYEGATGFCIDSSIVPAASVAHSVIGFTADWTLGLLPIWVMWGSKMSMKAKLSISGVLSLGLLAGIATIIRIPFIKDLPITNDFLYVTTDIAIWSTIEPGLGIIAFSGATLRPLLRLFFPEAFSSLCPNESLGQIQPYRTTYTERPNYIYNMNLIANKQSSTHRDSNSTYTAFDGHSRASSFTSFTCSTLFDSARSSRSTIGMGKGRMGSVGMLGGLRMSEFGIREVDEEFFCEGESGDKKREKEVGVHVTVEELPDESVEGLELEMGSKTKSVTETEIQWPLKSGSVCLSMRTLKNDVFENREWPLRPRSDSARTLVNSRCSSMGKGSIGSVRDMV
ncbi:putative integral membrane protein [Botrytis fragariae]|uniref:Putative integral membrane protein n=1 Tax=Botrytis fragariae TaxID=1964551 RepID=A0A8H6AIB2_9HELO|nr:putative integral membrane protein [Botrytis fragariae]KAF5868029.1 putative integral membrane protein [Botrytis fragariae]